MDRTPHFKALTTIAVGAAVIVVGAVLLTALREADKSRVSEQPNTSAAPSESSAPVASPTAAVEPVVTATATPSPTAAVSVAPKVLPSSVTTFLANFYAAYSTKNSDRLASLFTADQTDELKSRHSTLFTGKDLSGVVGGPTLFDGSVIASDRAMGYTVLNFEQTQAGWNVSIQEQRVDLNDQAIAPVSVVMQLVPSINPPGSWLIDAYIRAGGVGKYTAFYRS